MQLEQVIQRLKAKKIQLDFDDKAVEYLANKGFDPIYGARPLKRVIQSDLLNPLSKEIISGEFRPGDTIKVQAKNGVLQLEKA